MLPNLIVLEGPDCAGKSTLAKVLAGEDFPLFSIDDYFTDPNGNYHFESDKNHLAYQQCEEKTEAEMKKGTSKIFIHNTFTIDWEMEPYLKMAGQYNYRVHVATVENYHGNLNIHGTTQDQLQKMADKYKVKLFAPPKK